MRVTHAVLSPDEPLEAWKSVADEGKEFIRLGGLPRIPREFYAGVRKIHRSPEDKLLQYKAIFLFFMTHTAECMVHEFRDITTMLA